MMSNPLLGGDFSDCDDDGFENDIDCNDRNVDIGVTGSNRSITKLFGSSCLSILEEGHSVGSGIYWFDDGQEIQWKCIVIWISAGGGWFLFGILESLLRVIYRKSTFWKCVWKFEQHWIFFGY